MTPSLVCLAAGAAIAFGPGRVFDRLYDVAVVLAVAAFLLYLGGH